MSAEIAVPEINQPAAYVEDPTGGRLVAWAKAAHAANQLAKALCTTAFAPKHFRDNPGDTTAVIIAGDELGLSPLASMRSIYVIHGTPAMYAKTMVALVQSKGHEVWTDETSDARVTVCGQRRGSQRVEKATWTIDRARKAGYTQNSKYTSNPQEMLYAKAAAEVCRKIAADVLLGIPATVEDLELEEQPTTTVTRAPAAKQTVRRKQPDPEPAEPEFDPPAEQAPESEAPGEPITKPQLAKLHILFKEKGFVDRADAMAYMESLGYPVESSKDLSKYGASVVIDALDQLSDVTP